MNVLGFERVKVKIDIGNGTILRSLKNNYDALCIIILLLCAMSKFEN